ncbi:MAG TPA: methylenetetrahydrofolate--tRNA-(uracil(54)-C(5))-methyltransferase (FADH(2)-oxidizing) TrmFO, partial [Peptococcaceae bacterium]|nr:methylenetetrahydrofolate--tRNA-(uracil(54)-C(5))-methyltransferase (FADH(2)-oxidizing) TrmFO [Peptococcaceae bacterium]
KSSRYGKGEPAYLNCPMNEDEYDRFWQALVTAERAPLHAFEKEVHFEGCLPIEVLAARGREALLFGPLKPVGLVDPRTGKRPFAVVQLRQDNKQGTLFNMVGFQTNLKWGEQKRVFRLIPGMEDAEFVRYGVMHRNTYINAPALLEPTLECRRRPGLFFAGQLAGVEGYVESAAAGLV